MWGWPNLELDAFRPFQFFHRTGEQPNKEWSDDQDHLSMSMDGMIIWSQFVWHFPNPWLDSHIVDLSDLHAYANPWLTGQRREDGGYYFLTLGYMDESKWTMNLNFGRCVNI